MTENSTYGRIWLPVFLLLFTLVSASDQALGQSPLASLQKKCGDWRKSQGWRGERGNLTRVTAQPSFTATMPEYRAYLREVARRNPDRTWQEIITQLHIQHQPSDSGLWAGPLFGYTNIPGPENDGYRKVDVACQSTSPSGVLAPNTPHSVVDENGRKIDVTHIYAGLRSDMNRENKDGFIANANRWLNGTLGDYGQHIFQEPMWDKVVTPSLGFFPSLTLPNWNIYDKWGIYAPLDQLRGNRIGRLARDIFARQGNNPEDWVDSLISALERGGFLTRIAERFAARAAEKEAARREAEKKEKEKPAPKVAANKPNCKPGPAGRRTALLPGFVAQKTAVEGPSYDQGGDCQPFGPVKKTYDVANLKPQIAKDESRCAALSARLKTAGSQYSDGLIRVAGLTLNGISEALGKISDPSICPDVRTRAASNIEKINRVTEIIDSVEESLTACEPDTLDDYAKKLKKSKNRKLVELRNRILRSKPVAVKYVRAKDAYRSGNIKKSKSLFRQARTRARKSGKTTCENIDNRIGNNLTRIDRLDDFARAASTALSACDMERVSTLRDELEGKGNKFLIKLYNRLDTIPKRCRQKQGNTACQKGYGSNSRADMSESTADEYSCGCRSGYKWKPGATGSERTCIPAREANRLSRNENNAWCRENQGAGYYAGPEDRSGTYRCLPTKQTANAWCRQNNKGSGVFAGRIKSNGSFSCYRKNRPAAKHQTPSRGQPARNPGFDPAAAAAITGLIFQGISTYQRSKSRGRRSGGGGGGGCANPRAPGC